MGKRKKVEYLNAEQTRYKEERLTGCNCDKLVITDRGIKYKECHHFNVYGEETGTEIGGLTDHEMFASPQPIDLKKTEISPKLKKYTKRSQKKINIDLPKGKYMKVKETTVAQGYNWNQLGTMEESNDKRNVHMWRIAEPRSLKVTAQNKKDIGPCMDNPSMKKKLVEEMKKEHYNK